MAEALGVSARIKIATTVVARMRSWNLTVNGEMIDITEFGDTWINNEMGMKSWSANIEGMVDLAEAQQDTLRTAALNGTKLTTLRFYIDGTEYYLGDCFITSYNVTAENKSVVSFTMTLTGASTLALTS